MSTAATLDPAPAAAGAPGPAGLPVVDARGVSVRYTLYGTGQGDGAATADQPTAPSKSDLINRVMRRRSTFWALREVSFEVMPGDLFFVIGRNGAGKSTLLKVLAETLLPDAGEVRIRGAATAFLSMGLGFRPDLTGYENMEMGLTLIGVPAREFPEKRRSVEQFTQLGRFLSVPTSTYSAGMRARLAFAIATCVEPEILIMDEAIGAGDEQFREAADERLKHLMTKARAIIVCTHSLPKVKAQATRVMWIEGGRVVQVGEPGEVVMAYQKFAHQLRNDPGYALRALEERMQETLNTDEQG